MGLKSKAVIVLNVAVIITCIIMSVLGYMSASNGFSKALEMKAEADVKSLTEILNYRFEGDWNLRGGVLYKGDKNMEDADDVVDYLSEICSGKVTIFRGDTRVTTTVKDASGKRSVGTKASEEVISRVLNGGKNFLGVANVMGEKHHAAYRPIKDSSGKIIGMLFVGLSVHEMDDVTQKFIFSIIITAAIIVVLCVLVSNFIIGKAVGMLDEVVYAMQKISVGNLRMDDLPIRTKDEIGTLAEGVNAMRKELTDLLKNIVHSSEQVAASSEELTASAQEGASSIHLMAKDTAAMSEDVNDQTAVVNELKETIRKMRDNMNELHASAQIMDEASKSSTKSAAEGKEKVDYAIEMMKKISRQVNSSAEVVGNLGKRSDEIGQIVNTISEIAEQTNLLALNAAIEAARAGEHGRGFAVVAEEVRKLAEQSAQAAANISQLITSIQKDTESAVSSIEDGNHGVKEGTDSVLSTGEAFHSIEEQIEKLNSNVRRSMSHIDAVNKNSEEILQEIEHVYEITKKSGEVAGEIKSAAEVQSTSIHEIAESSKSLAELAEDMRSEVAKFSI